MKYTVVSLAIFLTIPVYADVVWEGSTVSNVTDENLILKGSTIVLPVGTTSITSNNQPVNVYLQSPCHHHHHHHHHKNCTVESNGSGNSLLVLAATQLSSEVTIYVTEELMFGSTSDTTLTVQEVGLGTITFIVDAN